MVAKKHGTLLPVIDYRKLNMITKSDPFPMPTIEDLIDDLASATYITTLDLTKGYWQVPVKETSRDKTAFVTPFGKDEFMVMPFGLMGAPATFQGKVILEPQNQEAFEALTRGYPPTRFCMNQTTRRSLSCTPTPPTWVSERC